MRLADHVDVGVGVGVDTHGSPTRWESWIPTARNSVRHGGDRRVRVSADAALGARTDDRPGAAASLGDRRYWQLRRGLATYLWEQGEWVVEIDRSARPARRNGAKTDTLDAYRAALEALARASRPAPTARHPRGDPGAALHPGGRRALPQPGLVRSPGR
jgi:hypothetical protein